MDRPTDLPTTAPGLDLAFVRVGQGLLASGVLVALATMAAWAQAEDSTDGAGPSEDVVWVLAVLALVLLVNGVVTWLVFDQRARAGLELARRAGAAD